VAFPHHPFRVVGRRPADADELRDVLRATPKPWVAHLPRTRWLVVALAVHAAAVLGILLVPAEQAGLPAVRPPAALAAARAAERLLARVPAEEPVVEPELLDDPILAPAHHDGQAAAAHPPARAATPPSVAWMQPLDLGPARDVALAARPTRPAPEVDPDTRAAIDAGLEWLSKHQDQDGKWDCADFAKHDVVGAPCRGAGSPTHDIGVTGLALLAFLADGSTIDAGRWRAEIGKAVRWLRSQQDAGGLFGTSVPHDFIYDHSIATLAMVEAYGMSHSTLLRKFAQQGIDYLESHRNPGAVWRYAPQGNDNDTSVTGWCMLSYKAAKDYHLTVNERALEMCRAWLDRVTDPITGRCGYTAPHAQSPRRGSEHAARFPRERSEALTAVGLLCRLSLEQDPATTPAMQHAAQLILQSPPEWDPRRGTIDHYYWYYATTALYQMGEPYRKEWSEWITDAVVKTQRKDGNYRGSWDNVDVWGADGGRVYSTAILVLTLEAHARYARGG
jgi:hypothetical protein